MNFVNDVDFIARRDRAIANPLDNFAGIIDTGMACGVNFQNINMAAGGYRLTGLALAAWLQRWRAVPVGADTIQTAGQQSGCRCFADTAYPGQNKGMGQPAKRDGVRQGANQRFLPDQFGKCRGPIFACQHTIGWHGAVGHGLLAPIFQWWWLSDDGPRRKPVEDWLTRKHPTAAASFRT